MNTAIRTLALLGASLGASGLAQAQDNRAAGLYAEDARLLPLVSQALTVEIAGDEAVVHLTQEFLNPGETVNQADFLLFLPDGAAVDGFGFWTGDRFLEAELKASEEAQADHARAATEGRSTGLLKEAHGLQQFSVYPVEAGELKRVETTLRIPVEMDLGRSQLTLPIDRFLGQGGPDSTVLVRLQTREPLDDFGVEGSRAVVLAKGARQATWAWSTDEKATLWWQEESEALSLQAERIPLADDEVGLQLRVVLSDASELEASWGALHLFVDGSFSMQRRRGALTEVVERLQQRGPGGLVVHGVAGGESRAVALDRPARAVVDELLSLGHRSTWADFARGMGEAGCGGSTRCVVVADAQLEGLRSQGQSPVDMLLLADPHEKAWLGEDTPSTAIVVQPGVDPVARLRAATDELVLPVIEVQALRIGDQDLAFIGQGNRRVAEGGLLRIHALPEGAMGDELSVLVELAGQPLTLSVPIGSLERESALGLSGRKGWYRARLGDMMAAWKAEPSEALKAQIVELSLREEIPTAFTALQVDDPQLSLAAIKPGDPVLTVDGEPGLSEVAAWYPFGDARRLVVDAASGDFSDRFLVPRYWQERAYRVEVFKGFSDGSTRREQTWYYLDEQAPEVSLRLVEGELRLDAGEDAVDIGSVRVQAAGREWAVERDEASGQWRVARAELPESFVVLVRDRAGNRTELSCGLVGDSLAVNAGKREVSGGVALARSERSVSMVGAEVDGLRLVAAGGGLELHGVDGVAAGAVDPRSLVITASLRMADGSVLVGTRGGDLLRAGADGSLVALDLGMPEHPVTGMAMLDDETVLIGVLGEGLVELRGDRVATSRIKVGSAFVTGVETDPRGQVLVATAYNGLWRVRGDRAVKTRFPSDHVTALEWEGEQLLVRSGLERWARVGFDRYEVADHGGNGLRQGAPDLVGAVSWRGQTIVGGFDTGLSRVEDGALVSLGLELAPADKRVNDLVVFEGRLWLATEGGVLVVEDGAVVKVATAAAHDLDVGEAGVAAATAEGVLVFPGVEATPWRLDVDGAGELTAGTGKWMSVAWHGEGLVAGGMEGLSRFSLEGAVPVTVAEGLDGNWVTALHSRGETLFIGTYADGVYRMESGGVGVVVEPVAGAEDAWVPPHGISEVGGALFIGGIGERARILAADGTVTELAVPARDVNGVHAMADGRWLVLSSEGIAVVGEVEVAGR